jgi:hypothetical protein
MFMSVKKIHRMEKIYTRLEYIFTRFLKNVDNFNYSLRPLILVANMDVS